MQLLNLTLGQYRVFLFTRESASVSATRADRDVAIHIYFLFLFFFGSRGKKNGQKNHLRPGFSVRGQERGLKTIISVTHQCPGSARLPPTLLI